jgi:hypothetical protein
MYKVVKSEESEAVLNQSIRQRRKRRRCLRRGERRRRRALGGVLAWAGGGRKHLDLGVEKEVQIALLLYVYVCIYVRWRDKEEVRSDVSICLVDGVILFVKVSIFAHLLMAGP